MWESCPQVALFSQANTETNYFTLVIQCTVQPSETVPARRAFRDDILICINSLVVCCVVHTDEQVLQFLLCAVRKTGCLISF